MPDSEQSAGGIMNSIRGIAGSLLGLVHTRIELFGVELQEQKILAIRLMAWFAAAVVLGAAGLLVAIGALAIFLWHIAGYAGLLGLAIVALGACIAILWAIHRRIIHGPAPFAETAAEFRRDAETFRDLP